jgi:hypothetical protein
MVPCTTAIRSTSFTQERSGVTKRCTRPPSRFAPGPGGLAFALVAAAAIAATDCTRDHDALAARPRAQGGTAGMAGSASAGAGSGFGGSGGSLGGKAGSGGSGGTGGSKVTEPVGRSVITFLHALVDAQAVTLCFAKSDGGANELLGRPRPAAGLAYGGPLVLETLRGVDLDAEHVVPFAITGDLALLDGLDCEDAVALADAEMRADGSSGATGGAGGSPPNDAGAAGEAGDGAGGAPSPVPARLRVARLPELAPGTLTEGHSLLYAMVGCFGGSAFAHEESEALCGAGYAPDRPTVTAELVVLSRKVGISTVGIQALHASRAMPSLSVRARPPDSSMPWAYIADSMTEGMLRPRVPRTDLDPAGYGVGTRTWRVQASGGAGTLVSDSWPTILSRSGLEAPEIGRGYTLVVMGPSSDVGAALWNPPGITLVDNDPM